VSLWYLCVLVLLLVPVISHADTTGLERTVGINLSKTCIAQIKNNFTTSCPDYRILLDLGLDTSKFQTGKFGWNDGYYHRGQPLIKNDYTMYISDKGHNIIIDPSGPLIPRIKMITIQDNFEIYLLDSDFKKVNDTRIVHKDRYVDSCKDAVINSRTWIDTIADTIYFLKTGCHGTLLNTIDVIHDNKTKTDISTSSKWKQTEWLKAAKLKYKTTSHIGTNDNFTNPSTITDEDER